MISHKDSKQLGVMAALGAAILFGAGTPIAKLLLGDISPWLLAGLLYLGSGIGLAAFRWLSNASSVRLPSHEALWFAGAIASGGIIGPVLLMVGLTGMLASGAALLLNAESVFTALLAWFAFKENFDRRILLGMAAIVLGALILSGGGDVRFSNPWPPLSILGACLAWGIDNNLTRKVSLSDATWIAAVKGLVSGTVNVALAIALGARLPALPLAAGAMVVGLFSYGISLTLFVLGLRHLGTARTGAYFSIAPFFGALLAIAMGDAITVRLLAAGVLMGVGTWLHSTEHHEHEHEHEVMVHTHTHRHDEHHQHEHDFPWDGTEPHTHFHVHQRLRHAHVHYPDSHHRHPH